MACADVPPATEASPTPDATRVGMPAVVETSRPAATAAASMFATGATSSAHTPAADMPGDMPGYSNSRRASNSRLIAEISPSTCCTDALAATFSATRSANAAGT